MRVLVIGGDSKLGHVLVERLLMRDPGHDVTWTTRRAVRIPIRSQETIIQLDMLAPKLPRSGYPIIDFNIVYIMAAITGVVPAETHPDAWRVNAEAPVVLALEADKRGVRIVFMSSGTVERAPHTASAMQKRYVEAIVHMLGGCVLRPLPFVPPEKYTEIADILVDIGEQGRTGVVRWGG